MPLAASKLLAAALGALWLASSSPAGPAAGGLESGRFLVASRQVTGPFFAETVVLLIEYGPWGALGLIVNRPTGVELARLLPDLEALRDRSDRLYMGGPVAPHTLKLLLRAAQPPEEATRVLGDVYLSESSDTLRRALEAKTPPHRLHAYAGYAGWASGQLENELRRGDWFVAPADPEAIFDEGVAELWPTLIREHEGIRVRRAPPPPLARLRGLPPAG